jgi:hypothetical protein
MKSYLYFGAEGFSCDAYGQHAFGECGEQTGGDLSLTGDLIVLPLALGGAILIASAALLVKRLVRNTNSR